MGRDVESTWWPSGSFAGEFFRSGAEQMVSQEFAWVDQDMLARFRGCYRAHRWQKRVPLPWLIDFRKYSVSTGDIIGEISRGKHGKI